ncbi:hypothetical protein DL96DRAFT_1781641 [Flagelloscypha sp. PMI_526]|nr:hypothetical protein DL96DRAFT_1781641 [Flagelloscypha sp. PMI_526]
MKFLSFLAYTLPLSVLASATSITSRQSSTYPDCTLGHADVFAPDTITPGSVGPKLPHFISFSCFAYVKELNSNTIWVGINPGKDSIDGTIFLTSKTPANINDESYEFSVTVPSVGGGGVWVGPNAWWEVVEMTNDFNVPHMLYTASRPVTVNF